jgi:hypothetical protein
MEYLRVWEYHCDMLERALCSLHNARIDCQESLISGHIPTLTEEQLLKAQVAVKTVKEKYTHSFEKLKLDVEKNITKSSSNQPLLGLWEIFLKSLIESHSLIEDCYKNLVEEENLNHKAVTSFLVFIRERPLIEKKVLDTIEIYK